MKLHFRQAFSNIVAAKLRSILAILGILVGTGAVVALLTSSQLATLHALAQFKSLGTNLLAVSISQDYQQGKASGKVSKLTIADIEKVRASSGGILEVAPYVTTYSNVSYAGQVLGSGAVIGAAEDLAKVAKMRIAKGRLTTLLDKSNLYGVIGSRLALQLRKKGLFDPIGHQIMLGGQYFTVIGVLRPWEPNMFIYVTMDNSVMIPLESVSRVSTYAAINNILIRLKPAADVYKVQNEVRHALKKLLPGMRIDIRNPLQILKLVSRQQQTFTWLLGAIGGISLLVGGIGVMNIMLVSVIERRREIGVRLAIGAQQKDILSLFLIESVLLTLCGGVLGIIVGLAIAYTLAYLSRWGFAIFLLPPVLGFAVSVVIGVVSGFYPAYRASRFDPIASLRAE